MLRIFGIFFTLLSCVGWLTECSAKLTDAEVLEKAKAMEAIITEGIKKCQIPGAIFSVSRSDKVIYSVGIGHTSIASNFPKPITKTTLLPVSSLTKNITAILVGALVDAGIISFHDKVRKYLPDFFVANEQLSAEFEIIDLISHRAGLKHFSADTLLQAGYDNAKIIKALSFIKQRPGEFRRKYGYQNIVFGIVGLVIEKATGRKYEDLIQEYIFDKMRMDCSSAIRLSAEASVWGYFKYMLSRFSHDRQRLGLWKAVINFGQAVWNHKSKDVVVGHLRSRETIIPLPEIGMFHKFQATSGISLSANDFAKWLEMLANRGTYRGVQIVSPETFSVLTSNMAVIEDLKGDSYTFMPSRYNRDSLRYCAGFFRTTYFDNGKNGHEVMFHMGGIYGSASFFALAPADDISVGVVVNLGGVSITLFAEYMVHQFLDLCFGFSKIDWVQMDMDRKNHYQEQQNTYLTNLAERNISPMRAAKQYTGTYTSEIYGEIDVTEEDGKLYLTNGIRKVCLSHLNGDTFKFACKDIMYCAFDADETATFVEDEYGNIASLYISCFSENDTVFKKIH
ncbi:MAG: serine hydrolase [Holosporales bacterium]|jgi:CubicO group peptidase (beta-lactamase class C family)|nr:serine hydrolase [Holosporales bacterium]